ncbi:variant surface glycoprotein (VSG)-related, putative [Trypanosoma equiperdum]|uniref:Variant surface glycoprotein (VSG)-related, putative n=1 Tax=Trypanosoma equiperdum TaxID=5694 RepID=A0A1G4IKT9_TRYEQ|nr:variant surface glycoprotein (VSG)-related, putative [Trypanosoma equiperdum]
MEGLCGWWCILFVVTISQAGEAQEKPINRDEFEALCRFINLAGDSETPTKVEKNVKRTVKKILTESGVADSRKKELEDLQKQAEKYREENMSFWETVGMGEINRSLTDALYGENHNAVVKAQGSRDPICGAREADAGTEAGKSLAIDLFCLCSTSPELHNFQQICCADCRGGANDHPWIPSEDGNQRWKFLAQKCGETNQGGKLSTDSIEKSAEFFLKTLKNPLDSRAEARRTVLGSTNGDVSINCNGWKTSGNGRCVKYDPNHLNDGILSIPWYVKLAKAATRMDKLMEAEKTLREILENVEKLERKQVAIPPKPADEGNAVPSVSKDVVENNNENSGVSNNREKRESKGELNEEKSPGSEKSPEEVDCDGCKPEEGCEEGKCESENGRHDSEGTKRPPVKSHSATIIGGSLKFFLLLG